MKTEIVDIIVKIGPVLVGLAGIYFSYLQFRNSLISNFRSKAIEDERMEIYKRLNDFYGPFLQLRKKSELLYNLFSKELKEFDPKFRTLTYLLDGHEFTEDQLRLLDEIINIGKKIENLIQTKSGLVENKELREFLLPKLNTHILILRMAYEKKIKNGSEIYNFYTFPNEIDEKIGEKINDLQERLSELNSFSKRKKLKLRKR